MKPHHHQPQPQPQPENGFGRALRSARKAAGFTLGELSQVVAAYLYGAGSGAAQARQGAIEQRLGRLERGGRVIPSARWTPPAVGSALRAILNAPHLPDPPALEQQGKGRAARLVPVVYPVSFTLDPEAFERLVSLAEGQGLTADAAAKRLVMANMTGARMAP